MNPPRPGLTQLLTADEVAAWLGISRAAVYKRTRRGLLPVRRLSSRSIRFDAKSIEALLRVP